MKCGIFGVMCKGIPQQVNFLIPPSVTFITILKITDWGRQMRTFTQTTALDKTRTITSRGIKNNYFSWRTLTLLHQSITYSFLIAGHTKFGPDRCFSLIKKSYKVSSLVDTSSAVGVNKAQNVGTHDGRVIVPVYDWVSFLARYFKKLPGIKKFHHCTFSKESPGLVPYKDCLFPKTIIHAVEESRRHPTCYSSSNN